MTGSHLDTQPTGGKFDGIYGVLAGLEVIESLNDRSIETRHPLEVAVWCNEEGCRFPAAMMGSAVWSGRMPLASAHALTDRAGRSVRQELERLGVDPSAPLSRQAGEGGLRGAHRAGPGARTALQDHRRGDRRAAHEPARGHRARAGGARGTDAHGHAQGSDPRAGGRAAGACTRPPRATARMRASRSASSRPRRARPTRCPAGCASRSICAIPTAAQYRALRAEIDGVVRGGARAPGARGQHSLRVGGAGREFDAACIEAVRGAAAALGCDAMEIVSGAGHDSCNTRRRGAHLHDLRALRRAA